MLSSRPIQLNTDGAYFPAKTPGRGLKNRAENAHAGAGGMATVNGKGKNTSAFPKTPFQNSSAQPHTGKQRILLATVRPLGDKTPMPNRFGNALFQTPMPGMSKLGKMGGTPDSLQRPSSMRKHIKQPRNSGGGFKTPVNKGNHWDVSDGEIAIPDAQPETIVEDEIDIMDEVEYGPPNTLDLPYQPPFDFELPDYKEVGKTLFRLAHSVKFEETPVLDFGEAQFETPTWDMLSLPPLESDDPFYLARLESAAPAPVKGSTDTTRPKLRPVPSSKAGPGVTVSRTVSRIPPSASSHSVKTSAPSAASTRPNSVASRRIAVSTTAATKSIPAAKPKAPVVSSGMRNLPSTRSAVSSSIVAPGSKAPLSRGPPPRRAELRRPHTSIAVMNTKAKPKMKTATEADDGIVFNGIVDDESDFQFDV